MSITSLATECRREAIKARPQRASQSRMSPIQLVGDDLMFMNK